jgi:hypothetical protein
MYVCMQCVFRWFTPEHACAQGPGVNDNDAVSLLLSMLVIRMLQLLHYPYAAFTATTAFTAYYTRTCFNTALANLILRDHFKPKDLKHHRIDAAADQLTAPSYVILPR